MLGGTPGRLAAPNIVYGISAGLSLLPVEAPEEGFPGRERRDAAFSGR